MRLLRKFDFVRVRVDHHLIALSPDRQVQRFDVLIGQGEWRGALTCFLFHEGIPAENRLAIEEAVGTSLEELADQLSIFGSFSRSERVRNGFSAKIIIDAPSVSYDVQKYW